MIAGELRRRNVATVFVGESGLGTTGQHATTFSSIFYFSSEYNTKIRGVKI